MVETNADASGAEVQHLRAADQLKSRPGPARGPQVPQDISRKLQILIRSVCCPFFSRHVRGPGAADRYDARPGSTSKDEINGRQRKGRTADFLIREGLG